MSYRYRIGADENGLGARLGPLVVTAVLACVDEPAQRFFSRKLPKKLARDLDDSKKLVAHGNIALAEAWARALVGQSATTPENLLAELSLEGLPKLRQPCPSHVTRQCWETTSETFFAEDELLERVRGHLSYMAARGMNVVSVKTSVVCTKLLNEARSTGRNRFVVDLHAMERLLLALRDRAGDDVLAICGKVGGMGDYSRFFGPLSDRLHAILETGRKRSAYRFPGLGEVHFVRDADGRDPLVMIASLVGKYVRELMMARVWRYYRETPEDETVSGYHDPTTARFMEETAIVRRRRRVPVECFERAGDDPPARTP